MANEEHLKILFKGVDVWNQWRIKNPDIKPNLSGAYLCKLYLSKIYLSEAKLNETDLSQADLRGVNLHNATLSRANLSEAKLTRAILREADLREANLSGVNLSGVDLRGTDLRGAILRGVNLSGTNFAAKDLNGVDFSRAILSRADLREANLCLVNFSGADLNGADLSGAMLMGANLSGVSLQKADLGSAKLRMANLSEADLEEAILSEADLQEANLRKANLSRADLSETDLYGADLQEANLRKAMIKRTDLNKAYLNRANLSETDLSGKDLTGVDFNQVNLQNMNLQTARLINTKLDGANLTGAYLWETQRAGWSIKGIICEYIYWDEEAKEKTEYAPSEFERLFADKTIIKLHYKGGISPLEIATLPALIQHLSDSHPGNNLRFVSIHEDGGGAVVELAIEDTENLNNEQVKQLKTSLEAEAQAKVEYQRLALIERDTRLQLEGKVQQLDSFVDKLLLRQGDTYNISGQTGSVGPNAHAHGNTFNQLVNQINQSIDLSALAKELSELRQAIKDKQDSSPQADIALGDVTKAEIAASEKDTPKVIKHLKSAGKWTMDFAKELGKDVVVAAITQAMGML